MRIILRITLQRCKNNFKLISWGGMFLRCVICLSAWPSVSIQWQPIQRTWYIGGGGPGREYGAPHQWRRYVCYVTLPLMGARFTGVSCGRPSSFPDCVLFERRGFQSWCSVAKPASLISVCVRFNSDSSVFDQLFPCSLLIFPVRKGKRKTISVSTYYFLIQLYIFSVSLSFVCKIQTDQQFVFKYIN